MNLNLPGSRLHETASPRRHWRGRQSVYASRESSLATASVPHRKARRKLHEAELKRLAELEEERRHRLGQGKDVSDLELIIADRSLDTGGDVKTLALEGQPLLTQHGEVAEGAIVPHDQKVEEVNEDPARPVWKSTHTT